MSAECQLESIHRIHLLRAELDQSLLRVGANNSDASPPFRGEKRPLNVLFRSGEAAQIQISGHPISDLQPPPHRHSPPIRPISSASSRFTVSPTPNAAPPTIIAMGRREGATEPRPLHVHITKQGEEGAHLAAEKPAPISVPLTTGNGGGTTITASSPASSIDSGVGGDVASPGAVSADFLLFTPSSKMSPPAWATVPRTKRRVFNFANTGSLIDALALLSGRREQQKRVEPAKTATPMPEPFKLQAPPSSKEKLQHGSKPASSLPQFQQQRASQLPNSTRVQQAGSKEDGQDLFGKMEALLMAERKQDQQQQKPPLTQRQLSADSSPFGGGGGQWQMSGLPPRALTMPPLKSILKKPNRAEHPQPTPTDLPRNHQRRMPTRIFLSRSISEGLPSSPPWDSSAILHQLSSSPPQSQQQQQLDTFDEHLEDEQQKEEEGEEEAAAHAKGASSPSTCSTDTIESNGGGDSSDGQPSQIVKKRVSFSEHVQARIYRSNSSILGQRRKNEKKAKQRACRRCNSDEHGEEGEEEETMVEQFERADCSGKQSSPPICRGTHEAGSSSVFSAHPANSSGFSVLAQ